MARLTVCHVTHDATKVPTPSSPCTAPPQSTFTLITSWTVQSMLHTQDYCGLDILLLMQFQCGRMLMQQCIAPGKHLVFVDQLLEKLCLMVALNRVLIGGRALLVERVCRCRCILLHHDQAACQLWSAGEGLLPCLAFHPGKYNTALTTVSDAAGYGN